MTDTFLVRWQTTLGRTALRHLPVTLLSGLFLYASGLRAARKPQWFDEITTYYVSLRDGPRAIIEALLAKMDNHPPLDYLARHVSMSLLGGSEFAFRLPSVIGLLVAALCLYLFVLRRTSVLPALVAFSLPFSTMALRYSYEGRPYSFLFASMCLTLLAWQLATEKRSALRLIFLTLCLSLGPHSHYYGVLNYLPIAVGEAWRWRERRRVCRPIVACFAVSFLLVGLLIPFAIHSTDFAAHFWTNFGPGLVAFIYVDVLGSALPAAVAAIAGCAIAVFFFKREANPGVLRSGIPQHEVAAALILCLVPVTTYVLADLVAHAYTDKYVINTIIGAALVLAYLTGHLQTKRPSCALIVALSFSLWAAGTLAYMIRYTPSRPYAVPAADLRMIEAATQPVAIFDAHHFLKTHYYLPPHLRDKIYHPIDSKLSIDHAGHNTNDIVLARLKPFVQLNVPSLCEFTKQHRQFLILTVRRNWVVPQLINDNATVTLRSQNLKGHAWLSVSLHRPSGC